MAHAKFYLLSEMNISDRHGGGLTLQRILGEDLDKFDNYLQIVEFPDTFPTNSRYLPRVITLWEGARQYVKRSYPSRFSKEYFVATYRRILGMPMPEYRYLDFFNALLYKNLTSNLSIDRDRFLVVPQKIHSIYLTNNLYKKHGIQYAAWLMDDHVLKYEPSIGFHYNHRRGFERQFRSFLRNAKTVFVISENMRAFYKQHFGIDSMVLFGPSDFVVMESEKTHEKEVIELCYFGAVWKWQEDAIETLVKNLDKLNANLHIYTFHELNEVTKSHPRVFVERPIAADQVKNVMGKYDGVIVPYGFNDEVRPLSELNISTKLSECLASGIPTVLVGPEYGAMTKFARKHNCAIVLSDFEDDRQLESFKNNFGHSQREGLLKRARWVSENLTSTRAMRDIWRAGWAKVG